MSVNDGSFVSSFCIMGGASVSFLLAIGWWLRARRRRAALLRLRNKVVLITGASSGLGEACARAFYCAGCKVILCARRADQLERVSNELKLLKAAVPVHEPRLLVLDISQLHLVPAAIRTALGYHGYIDIVVNNAGISYRGDVVSTALDVDEEVMRVNYFGQVAVTKALLPSMIERRTGHIVAIGSVQGKLAIPFRSAYGASKHALQSFCDCLRAEVSHLGVAVSVFSPGYIATQLSRNALTGDGTKYGLLDETQRKGMDPDYVARMILGCVADNRNDVVLATLSQRLAVYLTNILPDVVAVIMKARAKKQLETKEGGNKLS